MSLYLHHDTRRQLQTYCAMLRQWNQRINLIGRSTADKLILNHISDGFAVIKHLTKPASTIVDIGSGGGVPGIVIGIVCPKHQVHLVESNIKKCGFLRNVIAELNLKNVSVHQQRIEQCALPPVDIFTARACADLQQLLEWSLPLSRQQTRFVFLKGEQVQQEIESAHPFIMQNDLNVQHFLLKGRKHMVLAKKGTA